MTKSSRDKVADKHPLPRTPGAKLTKRNSSPSVLRSTKQSKKDASLDHDDIINQKLKQLAERFKQKYVY
jgi:hypothetical protein